MINITRELSCTAANCASVLTNFGVIDVLIAVGFLLIAMFVGFVAFRSMKKR